MEQSLLSEDLPSHSQLVRDLLKPGEEIVAEMSRSDIKLLYLISEASVNLANAADALKRHVIYRKGLDKDRLAKSLEKTLILSNLILDMTVTPGIDLEGEVIAETDATMDRIDELGMTPEKASMLHMSLALSSDAGELLEQFIGWIFHGKELDKENAVEELGDCSFFEEAMCQFLGVEWHEVQRAMILKLLKRYKDRKYSNAAAIARADKNPEPA